MMKFATWNVRTLMNNPKSDRTECRTVIVARKLARYDIDIAALSETRFPEQGQLREDGGGYTFFRKGTTADDRRTHGVGFAINNKIVSQLAGFPVGINERLMTLTLAPKQQSTSYRHQRLRSDTRCRGRHQGAVLELVLTTVPKEDKLILLGGP